MNALSSVLSSTVSVLHGGEQVIAEAAHAALPEVAAHAAEVAAVTAAVTVAVVAVPIALLAPGVPVAAAVCAAAVAASAVAASPAAAHDAVEAAGDALHEVARARASVAEGLQQAIEEFDALRGAEPRDPLLLPEPWRNMLSTLTATMR